MKFRTCPVDTHRSYKREYIFPEIPIPYLFVCRTNKKNESNSSDSESDEDYIPPTTKQKEGEDTESDGEELSDDAEVDTVATTGGQNANELAKRRRRKNACCQQKKRTKVEQVSEKLADSFSEADSTAQVDVDTLWSEFKKNVEDPVLKAVKSTIIATDEKKTLISNSATESAVPQTSTQPSQQSSKTKIITELFEFAGEAVEVKKEVPMEMPSPATAQIVKSVRPSAQKIGGLTSVLGQLGKKNKLSVLEKSKLDWDNFKQKEGIAEQLQTHNKGKDGYLEKQDFLQRADLRQFEIEKAMRSSRRLK